MKTSLIAGTAVLLSALMSSSASAETPTHVYTVNAMVNDSAQKCLDFYAGIPTGAPNENALQLWSCKGWYQMNWVWDWIGVGKDGEGDWDTFAFRNAATGTCIEVQGSSLDDGALLVQAPCDFTNTSQLWIRATKIGPNRPATYRTKWINVNSGKCIDAWNFNDGVKLQQWTCQFTRYWGPQEFFAR